MSAPDHLQSILDARTPAELFGKLDDTGVGQARQLRGRFLMLARLTHPDKNADPRAGAAMAKLATFYEQGKRQIKAGTYGQPGWITLATARAEYRVDPSPIYEGSGTTYHEGLAAADDVLVRVARHPSLNVGMQNEARNLGAILACKDKLVVENAMYFPALVDSVGIKEGSTVRWANIFKTTHLTGWPLYSLAAVRAAYPGGVDPKDAAWMFRRMLFSANVAHSAGYVHGAIMPQHVLIQPDQRGMVLIDWRHSQPRGSMMRTIPKGSRVWYPWHEKSIRAEPVLDVWLATKCFQYLMVEPPVQLRSFIRGVLMPWATPKHAGALLEEFDDLIGRMWGKRKFRPFSMSPA